MSKLSSLASCDKVSSLEQMPFASLMMPAPCLISICNGLQASFKLLQELETGIFGTHAKICYQALEMWNDVGMGFENSKAVV